MRPGYTATAETKVPPPGASKRPDARTCLAKSAKPVPSLLPNRVLHASQRTRRATPFGSDFRTGAALEASSVRYSSSTAPRFPVLFGGTCSSVSVARSIRQRRHMTALDPLTSRPAPSNLRHRIETPRRSLRCLGSPLPADRCCAP
jgi:hypothetical protein